MSVVPNRDSSVELLLNSRKDKAEMDTEPDFAASDINAVVYRRNKMRQVMSEHEK